jgi:hypothetical protein
MARAHSRLCRIRLIRDGATLQPFISYTTPKAGTFALNTESTYNWETEDWSVPTNFVVSKLVKVNKQPIQLATGVRYWADSPDNGPDGFGARLAVTFFS